MGRFQCDQIGLFLKVLGDKFPFTILQKYNNSLCYLKNFKFRHLVTLKMGRFQASEMLNYLTFPHEKDVF